MILNFPPLQSLHSTVCQLVVDPRNPLRGGPLSTLCLLSLNANGFNVSVRNDFSLGEFHLIISPKHSSRTRVFHLSLDHLIVAEQSARGGGESVIWKHTRAVITADSRRVRVLPWLLNPHINTRLAAVIANSSIVIGSSESCATKWLD